MLITIACSNPQVIARTIMFHKRDVFRYHIFWLLQINCFQLHVLPFLVGMGIGLFFPLQFEPFRLREVDSGFFSLLVAAVGLRFCCLLTYFIFLAKQAIYFFPPYLIRDNQFFLFLICYGHIIYFSKGILVDLSLFFLVKYYMTI